MKFNGNLKEKVEELAGNYLPDSSFFLVDVMIKGTEDQPKIIVLLDGDKGVSIDDCARLSRKISNELELVTEANFSLEVSSPGLDHPLSSIRQFRKNRGRLIKLELTNGERLKGRLEKVTEDKLSIRVSESKKTKNRKKENKEKEVEVPFSEISKTKVLIEF